MTLPKPFWPAWMITRRKTECKKLNSGTPGLYFLSKLGYNYSENDYKNKIASTLGALAIFL